MVPLLVLSSCQFVRWKVPKSAQILALAVDMLASKVLLLLLMGHEHVITISAIREDLVVLAFVIREEVVCWLVSAVWVDYRRVHVAQRSSLHLLLTQSYLLLLLEMTAIVV